MTGRSSLRAGDGRTVERREEHCPNEIKRSNKIKIQENYPRRLYRRDDRRLIFWIGPPPAELSLGRHFRGGRDQRRFGRKRSLFPACLDEEEKFSGGGPNKG